MVTSASDPAWRDDVLVSDLKSAGLPAPSRIRPAKVATVDAARIVRRIGKLSIKDAKAVRDGLRVLLAG
jgi:mRNA interferase MazF